jgi:predicted secreted protein
MQASPPPALPATPPSVAAPARATYPPCPSAVTGLVAFAVDPSQTISVKTAQQFIVALRGASDGGYAWRIRPPAASTVVRFERSFSVADIDFANASHAPGTPVVVGGANTQYFLYSVVGAGSAMLNFDLFAPGGTTPQQTKTFAVAAAPNVLSC